MNKKSYEIPKMLLVELEDADLVTVSSCVAIDEGGVDVATGQFAC